MISATAFIDIPLPSPQFFKSRMAYSPLSLITYVTGGLLTFALVEYCSATEW